MISIKSWMAETSYVEMVWRKFVKRKNGDALIKVSGIKKMISEKKTNKVMKEENNKADEISSDNAQY